MNNFSKKAVEIGATIFPHTPIFLGLIQWDRGRVLSRIYQKQQDQ